MGAMYFKILCFGWAFLGLASRVLMVAFGDKWNQWEMDKAYAVKRPAWIYGVCVAGLVLVGVTWRMVAATEVAYSWLLAALLSVTLIKIGALLFRYDRFRIFASELLNNPVKRRQLHLGVFIMSLGLMGLGIFVY